jgi:hypothetical protein
MATKSTTRSAVAVVPGLSREELTAALQQSGMVQQASTSYRRMKLDGGVLVTLDAQGEVQEMFPPRMVKGQELPAVVVQIVEPPVYYNTFWLGPPKPGEQNKDGSFDASLMGHPEWNGQFVKKYDDPAKQAEDQWAHLAEYEAVAAYTGQRGQFKGDVKVRIVPESGELTGEETVYTLTLPASSALDWRGTRKNPEGGVVQEKNFLIQLGELAVAQALEAGITDKGALTQAALNAMMALRLGGVVAEIYLRRQTSNDGSFTWTVISFQPIHIEPVTEEPTLIAQGLDSTPSDEIPF